MTLYTEDPTWLAHKFGLWDNSTIRIAPDDADLLGVHKAFDFFTDEHGFGPGNLVLPRPDNWDPFDSAMLANLVTTDRHGQNVYEARVVGRPRTGVNEVTIQLEGWSKHGDDNETAKELFRDMDQSHWQGADLSTRITLLNQGFTQIEDPNVGMQANGQPGVAVLNTWSDTGPMKPVGFASYFAQNVSLGQIYLYGVVTGYTPPQTGEVLIAGLFDAAGFSLNISVGDISADLAGAASFAATMNAGTNTRKWASIEFYWSSAAVGSTNEVTYQWNVFPVVYGTHGLTKRGVEPTNANPTSQAGFYVSDMAPYIVNKYCPKWNVYADSIEPTGFIVPHAVFIDQQTTAGKMLDGLVPFGGNAFYPLEWFVYDNRRFFMRSPGTYGNTYRIRRDEGADSLDQGPDASMLLNAVQCGYNPGDGNVRTVGPPGSGSDTETSQLQWTDQNQPQNKAGINAPKFMDCKTMTLQGAILMGQLAMTGRNNQQWRGSETVRGPVRDSSGNPHEPYMIRTHENCVVEDDADLKTRWITGTHYDDTKKTNDVDIGQRPDRINTILARAGVVITSLGA